MISSKRKQPRSAASRAGAKPATKSKIQAVDYKALAQFRFELRKFQAFSEAAARKEGLTPQQHQALLIIKGFSSHEPVSVGELAKFLLIRHHTAVELMDRMTKLGLLRRVIDNEDGRRALVKLTREGEKRLRKLSKIHFAEISAISPTLTKIMKPFRSALPK
ncbi:MarR family transcriptional regulator [Afipia massiliensis]|uniref:MarR family transcriptional regulator n=1 Tax=Afipia massiliensis TaxID=211460 RepID=A0A4U6BJA4_9BRAD|nr:MarR family transcriptional regulator [Afipia massiliensis]TKT70250.1 MarR family transcriptional regulator [Afipia massiliensis]